MTNEQAYKILSSLANGVDPRDGTVFPADSPYNNVEVVRALYIAMAHVPAPIGTRIQYGPQA